MARGRIRAAALGAECEWSNPRERGCERRAGCVADDFEKLLQFKAPVKLMVFTADNSEMRGQRSMKLLQRYLRRFRQHVAGEVYVFVEFSAAQCFSYTVEIQQDGRNALLRLNPMNIESELASEARLMILVVRSAGLTAHVQLYALSGPPRICLALQCEIHSIEIALQLVPCFWDSYRWRYKSLKSNSAATGKKNSPCRYGRHAPKDPRADAYWSRVRR